MNNPRFRQLLQKIEANTVTPEEEREFAEFLEDPAYHAALDAELATARSDLATLLQYRSVPSSSLNGSNPDERREEFGQLIDGLRPSTTQTSRRPARVVWFVGLAAAACWAIWMFLPRAQPSGQIELALIGAASAVRGSQVDVKIELAAPTTIVRFASLEAQAAWLTSPLPGSVDARIWIDEEQLLLRAIARDPTGQLRKLEQRINVNESMADQINEFAKQIRTTQGK